MSPRYTHQGLVQCLNIGLRQFTEPSSNFFDPQGGDLIDHDLARFSQPVQFGGNYAGTYVGDAGNLGIDGSSGEHTNSDRIDAFERLVLDNDCRAWLA